MYVAGNMLYNEKTANFNIRSTKELTSSQFKR